MQPIDIARGEMRAPEMVSLFGDPLGRAICKSPSSRAADTPIGLRGAYTFCALGPLEISRTRCAPRADTRPGTHARLKQVSGRWRLGCEIAQPTTRDQTKL